MNALNLFLADFKALIPPLVPTYELLSRVAAVCCVRLMTVFGTDGCRLHNEIFHATAAHPPYELLSMLMPLSRDLYPRVWGLGLGVWGLRSRD